MMNNIKFLLIILLFCFSFITVATEINITRKNESTKFIDILFLTATYGEYNCLGNLINSSKFLKFLKVKSINLNINNIKGSNNLDYYENIIKKKITIGEYDYIIIIDESKSFSKTFYEELLNKFPNKIITISHNIGNSDIKLFIDFNRFFLLLKELDLIDIYDVYYLHNKDNSIDELYLSLLNANTDFNVHAVQLLNVHDLTHLIDKIKNKNDAVFITNLDFLYDDVSGKIIYQTEILELIHEHSIIVLDIVHNDCNYNPINSAFYLLWDYTELINLIDNIITQNRLEGKSQNYILSSKFNVNFSLNNNILKSPDVKKLKSLLGFTDDVIIKK